MTDRSRTAWVRMYCSRDRQARVATFRQVGPEWQLASVGGQAPSGGAGAGLPVAGRFSFVPGYQGCPGCGSDSYVRCGSCGQLGCWRSTEAYFSCGNCGRSGLVSGAIESLGALDAN